MYLSFLKNPQHLLPCLGLVVLLFLMPGVAFAQAQQCQAELETADESYSMGRFDQTIELLDQCLEKEGLSETERRLAYRLKGLSYIGKGLQVDAREAVRRLLELVPSYEPDPIQDPPTFVELIDEMRQEVAPPPPAEPVEEEPAVTEARSAEPAEVVPPAATPAVLQPTKRKKKKTGRWILGGLGVAAAGGLVAVLVSGGGSGGSSGTPIGEPPPLPQ